MRLSAASHLPLPGAALVLLALMSPAQATLTVGPGGYPEIVDAIAAAQPGDLLLVQTGSYLPFDLPIGVRILAPDGATVTTPPGGGGLPWQFLVQPPAGQQASIVGLTFTNNPAYPPAEPPVTLLVGGNVVFADCVFHNWSDYQSNAVRCDGDVQFDRCSWSSPWDCMRVLGGRVACHECRFDAWQVGWAGAQSSCIVADAGEIALHFSDLHGSDAALTGVFVGAPAIRLAGTAQLSIADCTITGGASQTWASTAVVNGTATPVRHARSNIAGGHGTLSWFPPLAGPGPAFAGPDQSAMLIGGGVGVRPTIGAQYQGSVVGPANALVAMVLSFDRAPATAVPFAAQPVHFDPGSAIAYGYGLIDNFLPWPGAGFHYWQTPTLTAAMSGMQFWLHPLVWDGATFQVGPTFGGIVH